MTPSSSISMGQDSSEDYRGQISFMGKSLDFSELTRLSDTALSDQSQHRLRFLQDTSSENPATTEYSGTENKSSGSRITSESTTASYSKSTSLDFNLVILGTSHRLPEIEGCSLSDKVSTCLAFTGQSSRSSSRSSSQSWINVAEELSLIDELGQYPEDISKKRSSDSLNAKISLRTVECFSPTDNRSKFEHLDDGDKDGEMPQDMGAFLVHPLNGVDTLALLHEYQNLPAIDKNDIKIGDKYGALVDILRADSSRRDSLFTALPATSSAAAAAAAASSSVAHEYSRPQHPSTNDSDPYAHHLGHSDHHHPPRPLSHAASPMTPGCSRPPPDDDESDSDLHRASYERAMLRSPTESSYLHGHGKVRRGGMLADLDHDMKSDDGNEDQVVTLNSSSDAMLSQSPLKSEQADLLVDPIGCDGAAQDKHESFDTGEQDSLSLIKSDTLVDGSEDELLAPLVVDERHESPLFASSPFKGHPSHSHHFNSMLAASIAEEQWRSGDGPPHKRHRQRSLSDNRDARASDSPTVPQVVPPTVPQVVPPTVPQVMPPIMSQVVPPSLPPVSVTSTTTSSDGVHPMSETLTSASIRASHSGPWRYSEADSKHGSDYTHPSYQYSERSPLSNSSTLVSSPLSHNQSTVPHSDPPHRMDVPRKTGHTRPYDLPLNLTFNKPPSDSPNPSFKHPPTTPGSPYGPLTPENHPSMQPVHPRLNTLPIRKSQPLHPPAKDVHNTSFIHSSAVTISKPVNHNEPYFTTSRLDLLRDQNTRTRGSPHSEIPDRSQHVTSSSYLKPANASAAVSFVTTPICQQTQPVSFPPAPISSQKERHNRNKSYQYLYAREPHGPSASSPQMSHPTVVHSTAATGMGSSMPPALVGSPVYDHVQYPLSTSPRQCYRNPNHNTLPRTNAAETVSADVDVDVAPIHQFPVGVVPINQSPVDVAPISQSPVVVAPSTSSPTPQYSHYYRGHERAVPPDPLPTRTPCSPMDGLSGRDIPRLSVHPTLFEPNRQQYTHRAMVPEKNTPVPSQNGVPLIPDKTTVRPHSDKLNNSSAHLANDNLISPTNHVTPGSVVSTMSGKAPVFSAPGLITFPPSSMHAIPVDSVRPIFIHAQHPLHRQPYDRPAGMLLAPPPGHSGVRTSTSESHQPEVHGLPMGAIALRPEAPNAAATSTPLFPVVMLPPGHLPPGYPHMVSLPPGIHPFSAPPSLVPVHVVPHGIPPTNPSHIHPPHLQGSPRPPLAHASAVPPSVPPSVPSAIPTTLTSTNASTHTSTNASTHTSTNGSTHTSTTSSTTGSIHPSTHNLTHSSTIDSFHPSTRTVTVTSTRASAPSYIHPSVRNAVHPTDHHSDQRSTIPYIPPSNHPLSHHLPHANTRLSPPTPSSPSPTPTDENEPHSQPLDSAKKMLKAHLNEKCRKRQTSSDRDVSMETENSSILTEDVSMREEQIHPQASRQPATPGLTDTWSLTHAASQCSPATAAPPKQPFHVAPTSHSHPTVPQNPPHLLPPVHTVPAAHPRMPPHRYPGNASSLPMSPRMVSPHLPDMTYHPHHMRPPSTHQHQHQHQQPKSSNYDLKSPDSGFGDNIISPVSRSPAVGGDGGAGEETEAREGLGKRRRSFSSMKAPGPPSDHNQPIKTRNSVITKLEPDLSGYRYYLETNTSIHQRMDDDRITYLNKGQFYGLVFDFNQSQRVLRTSTVKTIVMVVFREEKSVQEELKAWDFWYSRQHNMKMRILDVDTKNSEGVVANCIEEIAHNAVAIRWSPMQQPAKINVAVNCLSTDFSNQKGVKGLPLHLQVDTFEDVASATPIHRGYCQVKIFCDKGAERKIRDEERRKESKIKGEKIRRREDMFHRQNEVSEFYTMAELTKPPIFFIPRADVGELTSKTSQLDAQFYSGNVTSVAEEEPPARPARTKTPVADKVILYVREGHETVFTALMLEKPCLATFIKAIEDKYDLAATPVRNAFKRSRKGILVKMDDNIIKHYSNESAFIISVQRTGWDPSGTMRCDVTLAEIDFDVK